MFMRLKCLLKFVRNFVLHFLNLGQQFFTRLHTATGNRLFGGQVFIYIVSIHNFYYFIVVCLVKYVIKKTL